MSRGRRGRPLALLVLALLPLLGCGRPSTPAEPVAAAVPSSATGLEPLVVPDVPSGLPRLPDTEVRPSAGEKSLDEIARYADDPARERAVLEDYGYRFGWERFWGVEEGALTGVFVHQLETAEGARAYARDLAANDAGYYGGELADAAHGLPEDCWLLTVEDARPSTGLAAPAAISWCAHGVFGVSVTAVADDVQAAEDEVRELLPQQLDRLPR